MQKTFRWCLISTAASCALTLGMVQLLQPPAAREAPQPAPAAQQADYPYLIKEYGGKVAVFVRGESAPNMIFDVYTSQLPEYDSLALREGVGVESYEALMLRIEDYIS